jgi:hypothetical protein
MKLARFVALFLFGCAAPAPPAAHASPRQSNRATIRVDNALVDQIIYAIAVDPTDRAWLPELQRLRMNAPDVELAPIDRALAWANHPFTQGRDKELAKQVGDAFAQAHPEDACIRAIAVDIEPLNRSDAAVDEFAKCFPALSRAHQYAGEKCRHLPDVPAERELQLIACAKSFERCIQIDVHHPSCANDLSKLQHEWTAPYCTTAWLTPTLRAEFPPFGTWALDVADFSYAVDRQAGVTLVLSVRGRNHVRQWFDANSRMTPFVKLRVTTRVGQVDSGVGRDAYVIELTSPTTEHVCDHVERRDASGFP